MEVDIINNKKCLKCNKIKSISEFRKAKWSKDGFDTRCKECRKQEYLEKRERIIAASLKYYNKNKDKVKRYQATYRKKNRDYFIEYLRKYREDNLEAELERIRKYRENNKEKYNEHQKMRRRLEKELDKLHKPVDKNEILKHFNNKCSLTGDKNDVTLDHFIPISWGHGGTYKGNLYPLNIRLNQSKINQNPFEWYEWIKDKADIKKSDWNNLVQYLAKENGLTVEEFKEFVYWCENNQRTLDDIIADGNLTSLELWRKSKSK